MQRQFFTCEICFEDIDAARAGMAELAKVGVKSKIFEDINDPYSPAVFVGAWVWCAGNGDLGIEKTVIEIVVTEIADRHGGLADSFGASDHIPVPADFGFTPEAA